MITVAPAAEEDRRAAYAAAGLDEIQGQMLELRDAGRVAGICLYRLTGRTAELLDGWADAPVLLDGLIRAALHAAQRQGAVDAFCQKEELYPTLDSLDFVKSDKGRWILIEEFFSRPCRHL